MVLRASASVEVRATPQEILEFVLDLDRYGQVDSKILAVGSVVGPDEAGRGRVRLWTRLKWTPPAPDAHTFELQRWSRLTFSGVARQPSRLILDFTGVVECQPSPDKTRVTHWYEMRFRGPFRLLERPHRAWLQQDLEEELQRVADWFDRP
ncbi:MAG: SRPBCC family protein [Acidimicrobiaceae bacterium]|nr:SRPBCC family protein [Acidimicrobiaceae bacterium]MXW62025.1 SRPBCC family protein [Acidimicrobiaceae bacterium]MXW75662.1 SRPBCC family protein [Acidimicrobiaceae bacterium]MYA73487.1 SRPBCC family protein [Acidimicrobiaceae bacterium]MYC42879.1 SRPBCC family protein [Acidimicrobiaceae bacterium]